MTRRAPWRAVARRIPDASDRVATRADVDWEEDPYGRVEIRRRRFGKARAKVLRAVRVRPTLTVRLDPLASDVWRLLDGRRTVGEVLAELRRLHPDEDALARRLSDCLSTLASRGLVEID